MAERVKTLVLKRAVFPENESITLENMLASIFSKMPHPSERVIEIDLLKRAVLASKDNGPFNKGIIVRIFEFEAGALGSINFDTPDGLASLEGVEPPEGQSFLHDDMSLLVVGNDVIACGMLNKNRTYSEAFIKLAQKCCAVETDLRMLLADVPNRTNLEDLQRNGVKEISLGVSDYLASIPDRQSGMGRVISAIFAAPSSANSVRKREAVRGRLFLSRGRFRKDEIKVDPWLTAVGTAIVQSDLDEDYTITLENQQKLTNSNLKVTKKVRVKRQYNTVSFLELKSHMGEFYRELANEGLVE